VTIPGKIDKMGYKGIDTTELVFDGYRPGDHVLGGKPGQGFFQMMDGVEVGRVNVSARACGVGIRAFELAVRYAQQRRRSASRSPSTRPSRSSSPRWPRKSKRHI
jgi:alkylation response protein AidB-like acyl-CoA dehydrogenase